jgi:hypothetical protein
VELNYAWSDAYNFALSWFEVFSPFSPPRRGKVRVGVRHCLAMINLGTPILIFPPSKGEENFRKCPEHSVQLIDK